MVALSLSGAPRQSVLRRKIPEDSFRRRFIVDELSDVLDGDPVATDTSVSEVETTPPGYKKSLVLRIFYLRYEYNK